MSIRLLKYAAVKTLPVFTGYLVLGLGYGILMQTSGFNVLETLAMSVFVYAGSMQFVAISLLSAGASLPVIALTTLMVNARHLFYGISMLTRYRGKGLKQAYMIFALTDETYSLVCTDSAPDWAKPDDYCFLVSLLDQFYWVGASVLGALIGTLIGFDASGLDFSMTALFVTVFVEQWLSTPEHRPALIGVIASVVCLLIFGADSFLIPAMISIIALLTVGRSKIGKRGE